ncbi:uncharacterized protein EV420DRAFT_1620165 [Desarmillaria tabescens]|uniref:Peptide hydrolase n=1 Tax=Armillaria tabescens TaxID=1929756 RepID=A0AA39KED6_ARMTA|nr:uncharacterized protein EV420DRAFT_1620165 [Desarmillaria tabescens]KAK0459622.1 hypothetical protein EV420DRAFT_1620165 [Desarmillaria tabescens]
MSNRQLGPLRSLLYLAPVFILGPIIGYRHHTTLPEPVTELINNRTNLPQICEANILEYSRILSEDIGYRTVGTAEHAQADLWMHQTIKDIKTECDRIVKESGGRKLECEIWRQEGSGSHRFDIMNTRLYKTYVSLSNFIVRVSDGTDEGKKHAVLVNSHLDSQLPGPGAADDAISVGIMLDAIRVLLGTPDWSPKHSIIFLFNHAEESLQDGSHMFSTQHPIASSVRAVINLEAAGTTGREILFQATSKEMIEAYAHVPRPFGTVFASDIFGSGIIMSDTDFRQFQDYLNVTGLDMAIIGNSYLYHMRKDLVENIEPGVGQHMGENALALLLHLSGHASPLPQLTDGYSKPEMVYFSHVIPYFFIYSFSTAKIIYAVFLIVTVALIHFRSPFPAKTFVLSVLATLFAFVGALAGANAVALVMTHVLGKSMSWFKDELSTIVLYGPAAILGAVLTFYNRPLVYSSVLFVQAMAAFGLQLLGLGSASLFFVTALPLVIAYALNPLFASFTGEKGISILTYVFGSFIPLITGTLVIVPTIEVFVPLTGRMSASAPADHLIATIVTVVGSVGLPLLAPFSHRFGQGYLKEFIVVLLVVNAALIAVFAQRDVYDDMHQRRVFVLRVENVTTHEHHLHLAASDGAPGFPDLVHAIAGDFGAQSAVAQSVVMDYYNGDWDPLYPFSAASPFIFFLTPFKLALPASTQGFLESGGEFEVKALNDARDLVAGTRKVTLRIYHPGLIWTVIAFDAHVLEWNLDDNPPDKHTRHHIKEASFYGQDTWEVDMVIKDAPIQVNYIGLLEKAMWPGKRATKAEGGESMELFEQLDAWLDEKTGGKVDATLIGGVGGVVTL